MKIEWHNHTRARLPRQYVERFLKFVFRELTRKKVKWPKQAQELQLVFLPPKNARDLNFQFRKKNYATDVLSFAGVEDNSLGELVFCPQVLKKQSREHHLSFRDELCYMTLHGILHLLGYDHETSQKDAERMFRLQDEVFSQALDSLQK